METEKTRVITIIEGPWDDPKKVRRLKNVPSEKKRQSS
jgi:hypothetical protein